MVLCGLPVLIIILLADPDHCWPWQDSERWLIFLGASLSAICLYILKGKNIYAFKDDLKKYDFESWIKNPILMSVALGIVSLILIIFQAHLVPFLNYQVTSERDADYYHHRIDKNAELPTGDNLVFEGNYYSPALALFFNPKTISSYDMPSYQRNPVAYGFFLHCELFTYYFLFSAPLYLLIVLLSKSERECISCKVSIVDFRHLFIFLPFLIGLYPFIIGLLP